MRCIEIIDLDVIADVFHPINRNMRCIEMAMLGQAKFSAARLIET